MEPAREGRRPTLLRAAAAAWIVALALTVFGRAGVSAEARPLRVGIYHPLPRLCVGDEPAQRDVWVLRLAYRVGLTPAAWGQVPWFYGLAPDTSLSGRDERVLTLRTEEVWELKPSDFIAAHPAGVANGADAPSLALWRKRLLAGILGLKSAEDLAAVRFRLRATQGEFFTASRLAGSALLPSYRPSTEGEDAAPPCRAWPSRVAFRAEEGPHSYRLSRENRPAQPGLELFGYRERNALWETYRRGSLDAVLVESVDAGETPGWATRSDVSLIGAEPGGQQIVLAMQPSLAARLDGPARQALSRALPREEMARLGSAGGFVPATEFLSPLLTNQPPAEALRRDTLRARQLWLKGYHPGAEWTLVLPAHPLLERIGQRIQEQWQRTLNLKLTLEPRPLDRLLSPAPGGGMGFLLEVVDVDNGTLQTLWEESLGAAGRSDGPVTEAVLMTWEARLRESLPYLPLLASMHWVVAHRSGGADPLARLCPACQVGDAARASLTAQ